MKLFENNCWCVEKCHSRFFVTPDLFRGRIFLFAFCLLFLVFLSACTDYVSQIDDRYGEWGTIISSSTIAMESSSSVTLSIVASLTDSRDGQTYRTVTIGTQTWMAENLNYETTNSYCYKDIASYCDKYGRLYTWAAAMDSAGTWSSNGKGCGYNKSCSPTYPVRGVCPEGWHLPTRAEFETLFTAVGGQSTAGTMLKSTSGWYSNGNGTDAFSFLALPAGYRNYDGYYYGEGYNAYFWSSSENDSDDAYDVYLYYVGGGALLYSGDVRSGFSVRCLKDEP